MTDPIEDKFAAIMADVPEEELAKLPTNGAANHDQYLYGATPMTALERLPKESFVKNPRLEGPFWICVQCAMHGACRDWVLSAAQDAQCDAEWLAERVHAGEVDADTSVVEIRKLWKEKEV